MRLRRLYRIVPARLRARVDRRLPARVRLAIGRFVSSGTWHDKPYPPGSRRPVLAGYRVMWALVLPYATPMYARQRNLEMVTTALDEANVPYFCRPTDGLRSSVVVPVRYFDEAAGMVRGRYAGAGIVRTRRVRRAASPVTAGLDLAPTQPALRVFDPVTSPTGSWVLGHRYACDLEFWSEGPDGTLVGAFPDARAGTVPAGDPDATAPGWQLCQRVSREDDRQFRTRRSFLNRAADAVGFPVDAVLTWTDPADPDWLERRLAVPGAPPPPAPGVDWLRYALRSLACHAPWIRRVFLVTPDQAPPWLDLGHPAVTLVRHREIFGDAAGLPTFNPYAVQARLHHIPGLAEHFVYAGEGMFLGRPLLPGQFFHANGLAKFFVSPIAIDPRPDSPRDVVARNSRALLSARFGTTASQRTRWAPYALRRGVLEEIEHQVPDEIAATVRHRFAHPADVSVATVVAPYWAFATGRAVPDAIGTVRADPGRRGPGGRLAGLLARRRHDVFYLDAADPDPGRAVLMDTFLRAYFPFRAPFELPEAVAVERASRTATELARASEPVAVDGRHEPPTTRYHAHRGRVDTHQVTQRT